MAYLFLHCPENYRRRIRHRRWTGHIEVADKVVLSVFSDLQREWRHPRRHGDASRQERKSWQRLISHLSSLPTLKDD